MTGETMCDLLKPLIGKSGMIFMVFGKVGQIGLAATETDKLVGVEVRPDGLILLERTSGWTVIDPDEVAAVGWNGDTDRTTGQFL